MDDWLKYYAEKNYGGLADLIGLFVTFVGFGFTLWATFRAKRASEQARTAVATMRRELARVDGMADLSSAIATMDEIRQHHRNKKSWAILPDRYSQVRRGLVALRRTSLPGLSDHGRLVMQSAIQHFTTMEEQVEKALLDNSKLDIAHFNRIVAKQIDALTEILTDIRNEIQE